MENHRCAEIHVIDNGKAPHIELNGSLLVERLKLREGKHDETD